MVFGYSYLMWGLLSAQIVFLTGEDKWFFGSLVILFLISLITLLSKVWENKYGKDN